MWRTLLFFIKLALLVAIAVWLAERPGAVTIEWFGYRIDTSVGILLAAALLVAVVAALLWQLWRFFVRSPRQIARSRNEARRRKGYRALTQGMAAVAAGDADEARRQSGRAAVLLNEPPLTLLLAAQAAQLNGDEQAARKYFTAMLDRPETRFLGLRGLLTQSLKAGDTRAALDYAGRARQERPAAAWATTTLLDLQLRAGDWNGAEATLKDAVRQKSVTPPAARRMRAVMLAERARVGAEALRGGVGLIDALGAAREAVKLAPDLVPARALLALLLARGGKDKEAARTVEQGWSSAPHPALAAAYAGLRGNEDPVARTRRFEKLAALAPQHRESDLALAEAALAAGLWGEARGHLARVAKTETNPGAGQPSARLCRLMARLEEAEHGDAAAARRWLMQAAEAGPDPAWTCEQCGTPAPKWQARCDHCAAFDSLRWRAAPRAATLSFPVSAATPAIGTPVVGAAAVSAPAIPAANPAASRAAPAGADAAGVPEPDDPDAESGAGAGVDAARLVN